MNTDEQSQLQPAAMQHGKAIAASAVDQMEYRVEGSDDASALNAPPDEKEPGEPQSSSIGSTTKMMNVQPSHETAASAATSSTISLSLEQAPASSSDISDPQRQEETTSILPSQNTMQQIEPLREADAKEARPVKTHEKPKVEPTPEQQKRLNAFQIKRDNLAKTLTQLTHQRSVLLLQLATALPKHQTRDLNLKVPPETDYTPSTLAHTIAPALSPIEQMDKDTLMKEANSIIKQHINLLHEYNEIKDVAQGLVGMIADQRGVRVVDCQGEFGVDPGD